MINSAPPTIHTQGDAKKLLLAELLSALISIFDFCANTIMLAKTDKNMIVSVL